MTPHDRLINSGSVSGLPDWLDLSLPIGSQIKKIREALGMTQDQLAQRSNLQQSVIAEIEIGKRRDFCLSTLRKIAEALCCKSVIQMVPQKEISEILNERSEQITRKIVSATSGTTAIEMQLPDQKVVSEQFSEIKKDILKRHKSSLWREI